MDYRDRRLLQHETRYRANAIYQFAAEKVIASVRANYGEPFLSDEYPLWYFPSHEWACRAFPRRHELPCPGCGYVPTRIPATFVHNTVFALPKDACYRVVSTGSTNHYSPNGLHTEDYVTAEPVSCQPWSFPDLPASTTEVHVALRVLFDELPKFRRTELNKALIVI